MRNTLIVLASLAGLAISGLPALADGDCAAMRAKLGTAIGAMLTEARAEPIVLADLKAKVDGADAALAAVNEACGGQAQTATMPAATAVSGAGTISGSDGTERAGAQHPTPADLMERTGRTHVTVGDMPVARATSTMDPQRAAALIADLRAAIAAGDLAAIGRIADGAPN